MNRTARVLSVALVVVTALGAVALAQGMLQTAAQAASWRRRRRRRRTDTSDPLGRETPAGTVMGFLWPGPGPTGRAPHGTSTPRRPRSAPRTLAQELKVLLDRGLTVNLDRLSRKPEGEQDERAGAKGRESIGTVECAAGKLDIVLVRVHYGDQPPIWLFSPRRCARFRPSTRSSSRRSSSALPAPVVHAGLRPQLHVVVLVPDTVPRRSLAVPACRGAARESSGLRPASR